MKPTAPLFTPADAVQACHDWGFNCGPASLCAMLHRTPAGIRPHLAEFEQKGYTNPTLMQRILKELKVNHWRVWRLEAPHPNPVWPEYGLARIQWAGPWTREGVPMHVRYRHSHWVGVRDGSEDEMRAGEFLASGGKMIFELNAMNDNCNGWIPLSIWRTVLVPWLLPQCQPKANGEWWPTHGIEVRL